MTLRRRRARCAGRQHELQPDAPAALAAKVPRRQRGYVRDAEIFKEHAGAGLL
jgi:hypothetical protein